MRKNMSGSFCLWRKTMKFWPDRRLVNRTIFWQTSCNNNPIPATGITRYTLRRCPLHPKNLSCRRVPIKWLPRGLHAARHPVLLHVYRYVEVWEAKFPSWANKPSTCPQTNFAPPPILGQTWKHVCCLYVFGVYMYILGACSPSVYMYTLYLKTFCCMSRQLGRPFYFWPTTTILIFFRTPPCFS